MLLIDLILVIVAIGVVMYAVNRWAPMAPEVKRFLNIVAVVVLALWFVNLIGLFGSLSHIRVGRVR